MIADQSLVQEALDKSAIQWEPGYPSVALPKSVEQAQQVLALADRHNWRVLPTGLGNQLSHVVANSGAYDLFLSTRRLQEVVEYEPGEATITVQPGVLWQHVQELADANRQCISPTFDAQLPRTVGGVIASGLSGLDRPWWGPLRNQVLGMRVLMADGTLAVTGGRLVKNVAGFNLHNLHTGGRGALGIIVEVSLRLHNRPGETVVLQQHHDSVGAGVAAARRLHSARLPGSGLLMRFEGDGASRLSATLRGSTGRVADARRAAVLNMDFEEELNGAEACKAHADNAKTFDLDTSELWLSITCQPTAIEEVQHTVWDWLAAHGLEGSGVLQPDVAQWLLRLEGGVPGYQELGALRSDLAKVGAAFDPMGTLRTPLWDPLAMTAQPLRQSIEALRHQFDPSCRFQPENR